MGSTTWLPPAIEALLTNRPALGAPLVICLIGESIASFSAQEPHTANPMDRPIEHQGCGYMSDVRSMDNIIHKYKTTVNKPERRIRRSVCARLLIIGWAT
jgi:hypothetical protein